MTTTKQRKSTREPRSRVARNSSKPQQAIREDHSTFILLYVDRAHNLRSADSNGLSDPFVTFKLCDYPKIKTNVIKKTLNPHWREEKLVSFEESFEEITQETIAVEIIDWDRVGTNDLLGTGEIDLSSFNPNEPQSLAVQLSYRSKNGKTVLPDAGTLHVTITVVDKNLMSFGTALGSRVNKVKRGTTQRLGKMFSKVSSSAHQRRGSMGDAASSEYYADVTSNPVHFNHLVVVEVVEARELAAHDNNGFSDPYVKLKLGKHSQRTKVVKKTLSPKWRQTFHFTVTNPKMNRLQLSMFDKDRIGLDDFMGQVAVDLETLATDHTHDKWYPLMPDQRGRGGFGEIHVLITITDLESDVALSENLRERFCGTLKVHMVEGRNLEAKDFGGFSDPFAVVRLGNSRSQTSVRKKTLNPKWDKLMELPVVDVFDCVEITLFDKDKNDKDDFLGALRVPLLEVKPGALEWFQLKSKNLMKPAQGEVLIGFDLQYKTVPGVKSLVSRPTEVHMAEDQKFKVSLLMLHQNRFMKVVNVFFDFVSFVQKTYKWEYDVAHTVSAMVIWVLFCVFFRMWQLPLLLALYMLYQYRYNYHGPVERVAGDQVGDEIGDAIVEAYNNSGDGSMNLDDEGVDDDDDTTYEESDDATANSTSKVIRVPKKKKKPRIGIAGRIRSMERVGLRVQTALDRFASMGEQVKNLFNWSVPFATAIVCAALLLVSLVMLIIPYNFIALVLGLRMFIKHGMIKFGYIKRPKYYKPFNEGLALLGRIPSDVDKEKRKRLPLESEEDQYQYELSSKILESQRKLSL